MTDSPGPAHRPPGKTPHQLLGSPTLLAASSSASCGRPPARLRPHGPGRGRGWTQMAPQRASPSGGGQGNKPEVPGPTCGCQTGTFPRPYLELRVEVEGRPGRQQGLVIDEGGALSLWVVGQSRLASAVAPGVPTAARVLVGGQASPLTLTPEVSWAQNPLPCCG